MAATGGAKLSAGRAARGPAGVSIRRGCAFDASSPHAHVAPAGVTRNKSRWRKYTPKAASSTRNDASLRMREALCAVPAARMPTSDALSVGSSAERTSSMRTEDHALPDAAARRDPPPHQHLPIEEAQKAARREGPAGEAAAARTARGEATREKRC